MKIGHYVGKSPDYSQCDGCRCNGLCRDCKDKKECDYYVHSDYDKPCSVCSRVIKVKDQYKLQ